MPKNKLFDEAESDEENAFLKTENEYAKRYDNWRQKEELHKLEQKYGDKVLNSDGSVSSDSEDEEPPEMSEQQEEQFLKTLALLKTKDPRIYDPGYKFFNEGEENSAEVVDKVEVSSKPKKEVDSLAAAFAETDDDDSDGEIFKVEETAPEPQTNKKEEKIKAYLTGSAQQVDAAVERDLAPLRALWSDPHISEGEAFLRDYILNNKYLGPSDVSCTDRVRDDAPLEADEQLVEEQGKFERAYNFRFEEPDHDFLKRYPRTMNYIRPKDESRSKKRVEIRTRKEEEKRRKMEELARLKTLKLQEIQEKLARIKQVTGNQELAFKDSDIEGEFDPEEHDRRMKAIFDEQYYGDADDQKPEFPDLDEELEIENWDKFEPQQLSRNDDDAPHCEDEHFNMDADYDPKKSRTTLLEEIQETLGKKRRNRKKKSKLAEVLSQQKPTFVPDVTDATYAQYMDEYYRMDCEDVIAGELPTRFKYRDTVPNSFGLTVEEILLADDKELNRWASLKKAVRYRPDHIERGEAKTYSQRAADTQLKRKMLPSLFRDLPEEPEVVVPVETQKKKNKTKSKGNTNAGENVETAQDTNGLESSDQNVELLEATIPEVITKKNKKKKHKNTDQKVELVENKIEEVKILETNTTNPDNKKALGDNIATNDSTDIKKKKRKKKKKKKPNQNNIVVENIQNVGPSQYGVAMAKVTSTAKKNKSPQHNVGKSNNLKRKLDGQVTEGDKSTPKKKKKHNKQNKTIAQNGGVKKDFKNKLKNKNSKNYKGNPDNPLSKLSDERLKAYGLNPKKYRSFLKYKKF